eukprot:TRINITY_DN1929_c0_g2_i2.p1 TRINITY_DN1929_c0_g2~~TRINITY_DN1929_c0_g2_i2.p1  ORF type:complete len:285 (-),score=72.84 TRINITY_DN1929_c0_g2_i2:149-1003(-)
MSSLTLSFFFFFFLMIRRPPRSTLSSSSAASDVYKRQGINAEYGNRSLNMALQNIGWLLISMITSVAGLSGGSFGFIGDSLTCALGENVADPSSCGVINGACFPYWQQHEFELQGFPYRLVEELNGTVSSRGCFPGATSNTVRMNGNASYVINDPKASSVFILLGANDCGDQVQSSTAVDLDWIVRSTVAAIPGRVVFLMDNPWDPECTIASPGLFNGLWNKFLDHLQASYQGANQARIYRLHTGWEGLAVSDTCTACAGHPLGEGYAKIAHNLATEIRGLAQA